MATNFRISPPPIATQDPSIWAVWYTQVKDIINRIGESFSWRILDFTDSNITDIVTRHHNDLQNMQGGTTSQYYHLTLAQVTKLNSLQDITLTTSTAVNKTLDTNHFTVYTTAASITITLPAASADIVGKTWTVCLSVTGPVTITRAGSDVLLLPTTDTSVTLYNKGDSLSFRCLSATTWGIV